MYKNPKNILVRLPNWLGDMVMATAFLKALRQELPIAKISVIVKKGLEGLAEYLPDVDEVIVFDKKEFAGLAGIIQYSKQLRNGNYDIYFSLPDSFSSALMGFAAGIKRRVGYKKELRSFLLTHHYTKPEKLHRVDIYLNLLNQFLGLIKQSNGQTTIEHNFQKSDYLVVNINSEAVSRKLPKQKAKELLNYLMETTEKKIVLVGGPADEEYMQSTLKLIANHSSIVNKAGKTSLTELVEIIAGSKGMISTDSGPAHIANATGIPLLVLFGAGNENETAPFNAEKLIIKRLSKLPCEPCVKNTCKLAALPPCLMQLDMKEIVHAFNKLIASQSSGI